MSNEESGPVIIDGAGDRTKFGHEMFGKGAAAERNRIAKALGKPELADKEKFEAFFTDLKNADERKLAEEGRFRELAEKSAQEAQAERSARESLEKRLEEERFRNAFFSAAQGKVADIDLALSMTRAEDRQFDESGRAIGLDKVITRIITEKPILKAGTGKGAVGAGTSGAGTEQETSKHSEQIKAYEAEMETIRKKLSKTPRDYARLEVLRSEIRGLKAAT